MKNKILSKLEELKSKVPIHLEVERKLLPRLKFMGYVMLTLCSAAFLFALIAKEEIEAPNFSLQEGFVAPEQIEAVARMELLPEDDEPELNPTEVLNFYFVSFIFGLIGTACFFIAWKKKKTVVQQAEGSDKSA
jgi:hypothetical protein